MKRFLLTILIFVLAVSLCVNYVRFIIFESDFSENEFVVTDPFTIFDILSEFDVPSAELFDDLANSIESIGYAGERFVGAFHSDINVTGTFFDKVIGFFKGLLESIVGFIEFISSIVDAAISFIVWQLNLVKVLYKLLNALLGTAF